MAVWSRDITNEVISIEPLKLFFFFQAEDSIRCLVRSRGLGDVYKRQDVMRYQYRHSGSYLKYGPWLAEPQKIERFSGTRILIREIINSAPYILNSCAIEERALYNKSIIHILLSLIHI